MTKKITTTLALSALALAMAAPGAFAQSADGQGFVRGELGKTTLKDSKSSDNVKDTSFSLRGGYWFNRNLGVEGFYSRLYDKTVGDRYSLNNVTIDDQTSTRMHSVGAGVVGKLRFGDQAADTGFFGMARAGLAHNSLRYRNIYTTGGVTNTYSASNGSTNPYIGVGAGYDFSPNMGVSLNYDYQKAKVKAPGTTQNINFDASTWGAGFEYRF